jgi:hypothetical protein
MPHTATLSARSRVSRAEHVQEDRNFKDVEIECVTVAGLLSGAGVTHVDFFSIDVEGHEPALLAGIDFSKVRVSATPLAACSHNRTCSNIHCQHSYSHNRVHAFIVFTIHTHSIEHIAPTYTASLLSRHALSASHLTSNKHVRMRVFQSARAECTHIRHMPLSFTYAFSFLMQISHARNCYWYNSQRHIILTND